MSGIVKEWSKKCGTPYLPPTGTFQSLNEWSVVDPHYFYADQDTQCCGTVTIYYGSGSGSGSDF
jgi:hypothetical protein